MQKRENPKLGNKQFSFFKVTIQNHRAQKNPRLSAWVLTNYLQTIFISQ